MSIKINLAANLDAGISCEIHPKDSMFKNNKKHYFDVEKSFQYIMVSLLLSCMNASWEKDIKRILDFGYERIICVIRAMFPESEIAVTDIDVE